MNGEIFTRGEGSKKKTPLPQPKKLLTVHDSLMVSFVSTLLFRVLVVCLGRVWGGLLQPPSCPARVGCLIFLKNHPTVKRAFGNSLGVYTRSVHGLQLANLTQRLTSDTLSTRMMEIQTVPPAVTTDKSQAHQNHLCCFSTRRDPLYYFPTSLRQTHAHAYSPGETEHRRALAKTEDVAPPTLVTTRHTHTRVPVMLARGSLRSPGALPHRCISIWNQQVEGELLQIPASGNSCKSVAKEVSPRGRRSDSPVPAGLGSALLSYRRARLALPSLCAASETSRVIVHCAADDKQDARAPCDKLQPLLEVAEDPAQSSRVASPSANTQTWSLIRVPVAAFCPGQLEYTPESFTSVISPGSNAAHQRRVRGPLVHGAHESPGYVVSTDLAALYSARVSGTSSPTTQCTDSITSSPSAAPAGSQRSIANSQGGRRHIDMTRLRLDTSSRGLSRRSDPTALYRLITSSRASKQSPVKL